MTDFDIKGADAFLTLSKALKAAGQTELRKELNRSLRQASKPIIQAQRESARRILPQRGGLARRIGKVPMRAQTRTGRDPGVRIVAKGTDALASDAGRIRHPVFGNREVFVSQNVRPGWFTQAGQEQLPAVREEMARALERVAREAFGG